MFIKGAQSSAGQPNVNYQTTNYRNLIIIDKAVSEKSRKLNYYHKISFRYLDINTLVFNDASLNDAFNGDQPTSKKPEKFVGFNFILKTRGNFHCLNTAVGTFRITF